LNFRRTIEEFVFRDVTSCRPVRIYRRLVGKRSFHILPDTRHHIPKSRILQINPVLSSSAAFIKLNFNIKEYYILGCDVFYDHYRRFGERTATLNMDKARSSCR
jgi:hypothetical protein